MLAAARRNGAASMTIPPRIDALLAELAAGNPVLVFQNLSLPIKPMWHYAVAVGYDLGRGDIILRSGTTERLVMPLSTFEHTWARSGYWAMVALPPGRQPWSRLKRAARPPPPVRPMRLRHGAGRPTWRWRWGSAIPPTPRATGQLRPMLISVPANYIPTAARLSTTSRSH
jgi:hypothetical protein